MNSIICERYEQKLNTTASCTCLKTALNGRGRKCMSDDHKCRCILAFVEKYEIPPLTYIIDTRTSSCKGTIHHCIDNTNPGKTQCRCEKCSGIELNTLQIKND